MNVTNIALENLGTVNKNKVTVNKREGRITFYFSYETCVAVDFSGHLYVRQNDWSVTTGKFLNELEPNKSKRLPSEEFEKVLARAYND